MQLHRTLTALSRHLYDRFFDLPCPLLLETGDPDVVIPSDLDDIFQPSHSVLLVPLALCSAARLALYELYACNEPSVHSRGSAARPESGPRLIEETEMQRASLDGIKEVATQCVYRIAQSITQPAAAEHGAGAQQVSLMIGYALYHAAGECAWYVKEDQMVDMLDCLGLIVGALRGLEGRWKGAGKFAVTHICRGRVSARLTK